MQIRRNKKSRTIRKKYLSVFLISILGFSILWFFCLGLAIATPADFNNYLNYADKMRGSVVQKGSSFKPQDEFRDYTTDPKQGKYYSGVDQGGDKGMDSDAANTSTQDDTAKNVIKDFKDRPVFKINKDSTAMKKAGIIETDSYNIAHGISDKYVDCKKAQKCTTKYVQKTCDEGNDRYLEQSCIKTPDVKIISMPYTTTDHFNGNITGTTKTSGYFIAEEDGVISGISVTLNSRFCYYGGFKIQYTGFLNNVLIAKNVPCDHNNIVILTNNSLSIRVNKGEKVIFTCSTPLDFYPKLIATYSVTVKTQKTKKKAEVTWNEVCSDVN